jgi:uncharacterized ion transporter superfamily protein YfcC
VTVSDQITHAFVAMSTQHLYPLVIGIYSAILGFFIPSGGGKWLLEAPYVMQAANDLKVHLGWAVQVYNAAEALPNLINPFWMLPLLGVLGLRAISDVRRTGLLAKIRSLLRRKIGDGLWLVVSTSRLAARDMMSNVAHDA